MFVLLALKKVLNIIRMLQGNLVFSCKSILPLVILSTLMVFLNRILFVKNPLMRLKPWSSMVGQQTLKKLRFLKLQIFLV